MRIHTRLGGTTLAGVFDGSEKPMGWLSWDLLPTLTKANHGP